MMTIDPMTKCRRILLGYLIGTLIFGFAACTDEVGDKALSGSGSITFTVGGIAEGGAETLTRAQLEPQTLRQDLGDGLSMVYTLSIDPASLTRTSSNMADNTIYHVIVYEEDGTFVKEDNFTAGTEGSFTGLEKKKYKLAAYSYNGSTPSDTPGDVKDDADGDGNAATVTVSNTTLDLLHWTGEVDLSSGTGTANIVFKHRFPTINEVIISSELTNSIINSHPAKVILDGYDAVQTLLTDGAPDEGNANPTEFTLSLDASQMKCESLETSIRVFTGDDNPVTLTLDGSLVISAASGLKTVPDGTQITFPQALAGGYSYTLQMRVEASKGDYYPYDSATGTGYEATIPLGSAYSSYNGGSLTFLTYNLGADPSMSPKEQMAYPYTDDKNIRVYGGLWQWGRKDVQHSLRDPKTTTNENINFQTAQYTTYDPSTDTKFAYGSSNIYIWLSSDRVTSTLWGNGTLAAAQTTSPPTFTSSQNQNNPCPSGYRVPTEYEWALISYEDGNPGVNSVNPDYDSFNTHTNSASSGDTWMVSNSNQNVVWVMVSDGKACKYQSLDVAGHMNGMAIYAKSAVGDGSGSSSAYNAAFAIDTDLTASGAPTPLIFLPYAGQRSYSNASLELVGTQGWYWTCSVFNDTSRYSLAFGMYYSQVGQTSFAIHRTDGYSVRCVKNTTP